ncbi:hypothetical protein EG832_04350 [bacterium]|nr:hypothetical protein [bacterium]
MNGEWAQLIALVAHGNYFLTHPESSHNDLSANSTFQYVNEVTFVRYKSTIDPKGVKVAANVGDWLIDLRKRKVKRLWNIAFAWDRQDLAEHIAVAFAGGVPIAIQVDLPEGYELWYPLWKTGGKPQKPWFVEYRGLKFGYSHAAEQMRMEDVKVRLHNAIVGTEQFARRPEVNLGEWADTFASALTLLNSENPTAPYHPDILPEAGFSLAARQILSAAARAYVFGGMGSWNDLGFKQPEVQKEYHEVTKTLYLAVKMSLLMASNSFMP